MEVEFYKLKFSTCTEMELQSKSIVPFIVRFDRCHSLQVSPQEVRSFIIHDFMVKVIHKKPNRFEKNLAIQENEAILTFSIKFL